jgi:hypothetical protein
MKQKAHDKPEPVSMSSRSRLRAFENRRRDAGATKSLGSLLAGGVEARLDGAFRKSEELGHFARVVTFDGR